MSGFIDINKRAQLNNLLLKLKAGTTPVWGKMQPQQMVEHLIGDVQYTNGKKISVCQMPQEQAELEKQKWIYTDIQIPKNLILGKLPENFRYGSLQIAINQLMKELEDFDEYFSSPGISCDHLAYGPMDYQEWLIWHGKHFTHHFRQFGLLPNEY